LTKIPSTPTTQNIEQQFGDVCKALIGLSVSHVWQGHGSAIFLEFGALRQTTLHEGETGNPRGEFTLMIERSWRIEDSTKIVCGSWSDEELWLPELERLRGLTLTEVQLFGRLPEIAITLSNGRHLLSFATAEGDPEWTFFRWARQRNSGVYNSEWQPDPGTNELCVGTSLLIGHINYAHDQYA
jgi:hypothetical protein